MLLAACLAVVLGQGDTANLSGVVIDANGTPIANARVFVERGIETRLSQTTTDASGAFRFPNIAPTSQAGVFAIAEGYALGGVSVRVAIGATIDGITLRLGRPAELAGTVSDAAGQKIAGARITRLGIRDQKVGIPFAKLQGFGFPEPHTDASGRFMLRNLPAGASVDLKVVHPDYAQAGVTSLRVGSSDTQIVLDTGTLIRGHVQVRGGSTAIANASVRLRRVEPPHDSTIAQAGSDGSFSIRMTPGAYLAEVSGSAYRSAGPQRVDVSAQVLTQSIALYVSETATISGTVQDAESGGGVPGARLRLESFGVPSAVAVTGPSGEYRFETAAGDNVVRLESAPGFHDPQARDLRFQVAPGERVEHTFWVVRTPATRIQVVDPSGTPMAGAAIRLLRPMQLGWRFTNASGQAEIEVGAIPSDNTLVGIAEHPSKPRGTLFALDATSGEETTIELVPWATLRGRAVTGSGQPISGARVRGVFADESIPDGLVLWETLSGPDGFFAWNGVPAQTPQFCSVVAQDENGVAVSSAPQSLILKPGETRELGDLAVSGAVDSPSSRGEVLTWRTFEKVCGDAEALSEGTSRRVFVYVPAAQVQMYRETLRLLVANTAGTAAVVVTDGAVSCGDDVIPVLRGDVEIAKTIVTDENDRVILETVGLPPMVALMSVE